MKLIFIASDFSGLGKGTFAASLGRVLLSFGIHCRIMKNDLYFNYDAGTINPGEHGEVYVLKDGTEVDQDFGIYERFLNIEHTSKDYMTSGRLFHQIYLNEREGKYLGQTVSIEHIIDELKSKIYDFAKQCDVGIVELGATIGDFKGTYSLEACRQLIVELGKCNTQLVLLSHIPYLPNVGELKTMGCQRSVNLLRSKGLKPDIIIARTSNHESIPDYQMSKIQLYCNVEKNDVCCFPDLKDYYQLPRRIRSLNTHYNIAEKLNIKLGFDCLDNWYNKYLSKPLNLKVALVGKYPHKDAYISIINQLKMFGISSVDYMPKLGSYNSELYDMVIIPGGWGERGVEDMIESAKICREKNIPCLGICLGLHVMVIEYARNILGLKEANSTEFVPNVKYPVITLQEEQKLRYGMGATARLGNWKTIIDKNSKLNKTIKTNFLVQRHRHRFEVSPGFDYGKFKVTGVDEKTSLIEIMELENHPFYMGVQFHPEFIEEKSPIFETLINTVLQNKESSK